MYKLCVEREEEKRETRAEDVARLRNVWRDDCGRVGTKKNSDTIEHKHCRIVLEARGGEIQRQGTAVKLNKSYTWQTSFITLKRKGI